MRSSSHALRGGGGRRDRPGHLIAPNSPRDFTLLAGPISIILAWSSIRTHVVVLCLLCFNRLPYALTQKPCALFVGEPWEVPQNESPPLQRVGWRMCPQGNGEEGSR